MTFAEVLQAWQHDVTFQDFYSSLLRDCPWEAFFWEHPPLTSTVLDETYRFILVESVALASVRPNREAFAQHFSESGSVVYFSNLGGDSLLVAPTPPRESATNYAHLGRFVRSAPIHQQRQLWSKVGVVFTEQLDGNPCWLSTSGLGVYWLHIRLDARPKYYVHKPYTNINYWTGS